MGVGGGPLETSGVMGMARGDKFELLSSGGGEAAPAELAMGIGSGK